MTTTAGAADWRAANRANWDERVPVHAAGSFYDLPGFVAGRDTLRDFERAEVGDVHGATLLHLQCHLGLDTLSWARHGATVTGLDCSAPALTVEWRHGLGDVVSALAAADLHLRFLHEHDHGHFRFPGTRGVPQIYSLRATRAE